MCVCLCFVFAWVSLSLAHGCAFSLEFYNSTIISSLFFFFALLSLSYFSLSIFDLALLYGVVGLMEIVVSGVYVCAL
ncbi:hypothetical protein DFH27DRAFT_551367, partial [Peziza echinospora]